MSGHDFHPTPMGHANDIPIYINFGARIPSNSMTEVFPTIDWLFHGKIFIWDNALMRLFKNSFADQKTNI